MLEGVVIDGFRSIDRSQRVGPFGKLNVFAGQNNTGKSNILAYLHEELDTDLLQFSKALRVPRSESSRTKGRESFPTRGLCFRVDRSSLLAVLDPIIGGSPPAGPFVEAMVNHFTAVGHYTWAELRPVGNDLLPVAHESDALAFQEILAKPEFGTHRSRFRKLLGPQTRADDGPAAWAGVFVYKLAEHYLGGFAVPTRHTIKSIRLVDETHADTDETLTTGRGLIPRLAKVFTPKGSERDQMRLVEERIHRFLRDVLQDDSARLAVDHEQTELLVSLAGRGTFELRELGTGIQDVVLLATACTIVEDSILCIEEPEVHLHPALIRRLMTFLGRDDYTSNQYFVSTHSPAVIDTPGARVFAVNWSESTLVKPVASLSDRFEVVSDLGVRASDVVQSTCVIWVEGPSDRVYLKAFLQATDPDLIEGSDYTIMFYGGRLLSHLAALNQDETQDELVALRSLNQNCAVVMDSDKQPGQKRRNLNRTKKRLLDELSAGGHSWITQSTEIENYIPIDVLNAAIQTAHPKVGRHVPKSQKDGELGKRLKHIESADKTNIARAVVEDLDGVPDVLDLRKQTAALAQWIRSVAQKPAPQG